MCLLLPLPAIKELLSSGRSGKRLRPVIDTAFELTSQIVKTVGFI